MKSESFEDYFQLAQRLAAPEAPPWRPLCGRSEGSCMSYRSWGGGHLLRIDLRQVFVQDAPSGEDVLVLPEVRGQFSRCYDGFHAEMPAKLVEICGPGDAVLEQAWTVPVHLLIAIFFGQLSGPRKCKCLHFKNLQLGRQQLRKNFPKAHHCTTVYQDEEDCYMLTCSREDPAVPEYIRMVALFRLPQEWHPRLPWGHHFYSEILDTAQRTTTAYLNRPGIAKMRSKGLDPYIILALRNFNRGFPMLPAAPVGPAGRGVLVTAGKDLGLGWWEEFEGCGDCKFRLAEYLRMFMERLGERLPTYDSFGGQKLVPYQCAVMRPQWEEVRSRFMQALRFQKTAYRRLHGGTTAPSLVEDVEARFASDIDPVGSNEELLGNGQLPVVVRKTFLEIDEVVVDGMKRIQSAPSLEQLPMLEVA